MKLTHWIVVIILFVLIVQYNALSSPFMWILLAILAMIYLTNNLHVELPVKKK